LFENIQRNTTQNNLSCSLSPSKGSLCCCFNQLNVSIQLYKYKHLQPAKDTQKNPQTLKPAKRQQFIQPTHKQAEIHKKRAKSFQRTKNLQNHKVSNRIKTHHPLFIKPNLSPLSNTQVCTLFPYSQAYTIIIIDNSTDITQSYSIDSNKSPSHIPVPKPSQPRQTRQTELLH
jgi:hypothetical protein